MITNERLKETYLAHFGILGQKWGVRRYQNEDGSLTEEGKARYLKETTSSYEGGIKLKYHTLSDEGKKTFFDKKGRLTKEANDELRRDERSQLSIAIKDAQMATNLANNWDRSFNEATNLFRTELEKIKKKYSDVDFDNPDRRSIECAKEISNLWKTLYKDVAIRDFDEHPYAGKHWLDDVLPMYNIYDFVVSDLEDQVLWKEYKNSHK